MRPFNGAKMKVKEVLERPEAAPNEKKPQASIDTTLLVAELRALTAALESQAKAKPNADSPMVHVAAPNVTVEPPTIEVTNEINVERPEEWDLEITEWSDKGRIKRMKFKAVK